MADHRDQHDDETRVGNHAHREEVVHTEDRREVVAREREEHGGVKIGSAFFGWLTATGMAVLLSGILATTGFLAGDATGTDSAGEAADVLDLSAHELGVVAIVVALVVSFLSYYAGGYVAGRMARFDGLKQGVAVWLWSIVIALVLGVLGAVFGNDYAGTQGLPRITFDGGVSANFVIAVVVVLVVTLVGAMLGGLAGMRFHRKVDRTGLGR